VDLISVFPPLPTLYPKKKDARRKKEGHGCLIKGEGAFREHVKNMEEGWKEEGGMRKEEGGRRKEEGGRRKEEGGRRGWKRIHTQIINPLPLGVPLFQLSIRKKRMHSTQLDIQLVGVQLLHFYRLVGEGNDIVRSEFSLILSLRGREQEEEQRGGRSKEEGGTGRRKRREKEEEKEGEGKIFRKTGSEEFQKLAHPLPGLNLKFREIP
jgi:ATP-dependent RNA helicase DHX57